MPEYRVSAHIIIDAEDVPAAAMRFLGDALDIAGDGELDLHITELDPSDGATGRSYTAVVECGADSTWLRGCSASAAFTVGSEPVAHALAASRRVPSAGVDNLAVELLVHAGLAPDDLDQRGVPVEDVLQSLLVEALDRCPALVDAIEGMLRS